MYSAKSMMPLISSFELIWPAEQVGVVLSEAAHTQQPVEHARPLVTVDRAQLRPAQRQVAVAARLSLVHQDGKRAVHGLEQVLHAIDVHRGVHAVAVEVPVAADLPEVDLGDVRRVDNVVAALAMLPPPEVLYRFPDDGALGVPVDEARAALLVSAEDIQLAAQLAVVTLLYLLQFLEVGVQLGLVLPDSPVDALEHGPLLIAPPVGAGDRHELEGVRRDLAGVIHVWPAAQVDEGVLGVGGNDLALGHVGNELALEGLVLEQFQRRGTRDLVPDERKRATDDRPHLRPRVARGPQASGCAAAGSRSRTPPR